MAMAVFCRRIARWYWEFEMSPLAYPLPRVNAQTKPYWEGCAHAELRYQCCGSCGRVQLIPRGLCEHCQSTSLNWRVSQRSGQVLSWTRVHRAPLPVFKDMLPYIIAIVDMDEGFRVMVNALPETMDHMAIGTRVSIGFQEVHGMQLPVIERVESRP